MEVKAVGLPQGKDPADIIRESREKFAEYIAASKPVVEFFLTVLKETVHNSQQLEREIKKMVFPLIISIRNPITADRAMQAAASVLGVSVEAIRESLKQLPKLQEAGSLQKPLTYEVRNPRQLRSEMLLAVVHAYPGTPLAERVKSEYCRVTGVDELPPVSIPESALFSIEQTFGEDPDEHAGDELLHAFEEAVIREAYQAAVANLRRAEASKDASLVNDAQNECAKLSARLAAFGA
jgi:DNA primase